MESAVARKKAGEEQVIEVKRKIYKRNDNSCLPTDTQQLLRFSKHYLKLAKRIKCPKADQSKPIGQLFREYPQNKGSNVYLLMAHLASSAYRIATIIERHALESYKYRHLRARPPNEIERALRDNLTSYLPMLLRDQVGHDLTSTHKLAPPRIKVLYPLKPIECIDRMKNVITEIESRLGSQS
ncbi:MAG: hypothetical protein ACYTBJ_08820 [Planctomycetota bacterium]